MLDPLSQRGKRLAVLQANAVRTMDRIHDAFPKEAAAIREWRNTLPVALIMGAPRGGTSAFKAALAQHAQVLAMPGEHRLFFTLAGQNYPDGDASTEAAQIPPDAKTGALVLDLILTSAFCGPEVTRPDNRETSRYALDWAMRLPLQWTAHDFDAGQVEVIVTQATGRYLASGQSDLNLLDQEVFAALQQAYPFIRTSLYDGVTDTDGTDWAQVSGDITPIVEITPFVIPRPRKLKHPKMPVSALLLKASSDPFRLAALRMMFQTLPVVMLRLTRNPVASVNGLLDGWAHPAFWQHDLRGEPGIPKALQGWSFDLFSGWRDAKELSEIVADQWRTPNEILNAGEATPATNEKWHRFRFEAFQTSAVARANMLCSAVSAMGLDPSEPAFTAAIATPRRVNATAAPRASRWKRARPHLREIVKMPEIARVAKTMGYDCGELDDWT